ELLELRQASHFAVGPHDFAEDAGRVETGELAEIDRSFGLTGADQHAALPGSQGEEVTGHHEVLAAGARVDQVLDGAGAVRSGNTGCSTDAGLHGDSKWGAEMRAVGLDHHRYAELFNPLRGQRNTDQAAAMSGHEVDVLGRAE